MKLKKINENIFREYDVRGIYGSDLDMDIALLIHSVEALQLILKIWVMIL